MGKALGFFEISGVVAAIDALDKMCKSADVEFITWEKKLGGRLVTVIISGEVSAVTAAIAAAEREGIRKPVCKAVIANPHEEILKIVQKSADRLSKSRQTQGESLVKEETHIKEI